MRAFIAALALTLVLAACGGDDDDTDAVDDTATSSAEGAADEPEATEPDGAPVEDDSQTDDDAAVDDEQLDQPSDAGEPSEADELFPDVVGVEASQSDDGTWSFSVTLSSPYDTPERYADAWRVLAPDGTELGVRELLHDHANEQPFTRSLGGIEIPDDVTTVTVEGRDQISGWGGATIEHTLDRG